MPATTAIAVSAPQRMGGSEGVAAGTDEADLEVASDINNGYQYYQAKQKDVAAAVDNFFGFLRQHSFKGARHEHHKQAASVERRYRQYVHHCQCQRHNGDDEQHKLITQQAAVAQNHKNAHRP